MKLTPEDEVAFKTYLEEYQTLLNLNDWRIELSPKPARGAMAQVTIQPEDRLAIVQLGKEWGDIEITEKSIRQTCIHELAHIWLKSLILASANRDQGLIEELEHGLIVQLEKLLT